jgi:hypothetical protein
MKLSFFILLLVLIAANAFPSGRRKAQDGQGASSAGVINPADDKPAKAVGTNGRADVEVDNVKKIVGRVRIYGSDPHTFAGISGEDGIEYSIYPPEKEEEIRSLQGHLIEFTVILLDEPQGFGSLFLKGGTISPVEWKILD